MLICAVRLAWGWAGWVGGLDGLVGLDVLGFGAAHDGHGVGAGAGGGSGLDVAVGGDGGGWDGADEAKPSGGALGPVGGSALWGDAEAVAAVGVEVEFGGGVGVEQGAVVDEGVAAVVFVVFGGGEEDGRQAGGRGEGGVEVGLGGVEREVGGVDEDSEVGAGGEFEWGVGSGGGGGDVGVVGVGGEQGGEVAAGGEADDADAGGVEVPVGGVGAGEADGLLGVFEVGVALRVVRLGDAVLDEQAGHAEGVQPVAGGGAFLGPGEVGVASAGEDDGCRAVVVVVRRVDGERGDGDVGEAGGDVAGGEAGDGLAAVGLGLGGLWRLGCAVWPEGEGLLGAGGWAGEWAGEGEDDAGDG